MQSKLSKITLAAVAGVLVTAGVAGTATAADSAWSKDYKGRVTANGGLNVRTRPTTDSRIVGSNPTGRVVTIECKVNGDNVGGNRIWYKLTNAPRGYSSARYIDNIGQAPKWCDGNSGSSSGSGGRDSGNGGGGNNGGREGNGGGGRDSGGSGRQSDQGSRASGGQGRDSGRDNGTQSRGTSHGNAGQGRANGRIGND